MSIQTSHVGEVVSLAPLGLARATVVKQAWSPSLGQVLTVVEDQACGAGLHLLYGDRLGLVLGSAA